MSQITPVEPLIDRNVSWCRQNRPNLTSELSNCSGCPLIVLLSQVLGESRVRLSQSLSSSDRYCNLIAGFFTQLNHHCYHHYHHHHHHQQLDIATWLQTNAPLSVIFAKQGKFLPKFGNHHRCAGTVVTEPNCRKPPLPAVKLCGFTTNSLHPLKVWQLGVLLERRSLTLSFLDKDRRIRPTHVFIMYTCAVKAYLKCAYCTLLLIRYFLATAERDHLLVSYPDTFQREALKDDYIHARRDRPWWGSQVSPFSSSLIVCLCHI